MLTTFRTSGCAKGTHVNFVFLCHDSAKHASMMALAAPSVRKNSNNNLVFPSLIRIFAKR